MTQEHRRDQEADTGFAVLIVSDTRSVESDESGRAAKEILAREGHRVFDYRIVSNDEGEIQGAVLDLLRDERIRVIITSGGTGLSSRDVTVDALSALFEKSIPGFGEFFRTMSRDEIGDSAMISRATAGVIGSKVIFCLPGSRSAVESGLSKLVLPGLGHLLWESSR